MKREKKLEPFSIESDSKIDEKISKNLLEKDITNINVAKGGTFQATKSNF